MSPKAHEETMLFHVTMKVRISPDAEQERINSLHALEHERAADLQRAPRCYRDPMCTMAPCPRAGPRNENHDSSLTRIGR